MSTELRCPHKMHAILIEPTSDVGVVEVKCNSRFCGASAEVVVVHRFSTATGQLMRTDRFKQPRVGG